MINRKQIRNGAIQFRMVSNETERLLLKDVEIGDIIYQNQDNRRYELLSLPASNPVNWKLLLNTISGVFNSSVSQTLYTDINRNLTISWDSVNFQPTYTVNGWGWIDGAIIKVDGNSSTIRINADDKSSVDGTFYFTNNGALNTAFNMENYGSYTFCTLVKESYDPNYPAVMIHMNLGNTGTCAYIINIIN
ncbi:hypothetical protein HYO65_gp250 [Tenacibaculum phage PTm1]|uniref:Uncharacterized protein n=2 Tax=Shirahamavirus PTm1 TaxID=2846435 RepID=A0A5S9HYA8_9CAUD|nr:hypothetical protein HYO65_gp250 [Tenacibaculum phage PTm1]BBI90642.1 hypothetical protein [Tenacibaculum phage PTm1]BBI90949.1 hypothetical protein [Tenacibaculum phage PTm5]